MTDMEPQYTYDDCIEPERIGPDSNYRIPTPLRLDPDQPLPMPMEVSAIIPLPMIPKCNNAIAMQQSNGCDQYGIQRNGNGTGIWIAALIAGIVMITLGAISLMIIYSIPISLTIWGAGIVLGIIGMRKYADIYAMKHTY